MKKLDGIFAHKDNMNPEINLLLDEVEQCKKCPNLAPWRKFSNNVHGNLNSSAMIVAEAPSDKSLREGRFWSGASGQRIRNVLSEFDMQLERFYLTDTVKCGPPDNRRRTPTNDEISNCKHFLRKEIEIIKPNHIMVFGRTALRYFLENFTPNIKFTFSSMLEVQNSNSFQIIKFPNYKLVPLMHLSWANRHMDYDIYKKQLKEVFTLIMNAQSSSDD